jgi:hypothetical protein
MDNFDVGIIGAGVAGAFAALRIAERHKNVKTILFDVGRPPGKRRRQLEGWLGCFPGGDGKIYPGDADKVSELIDGRKVRPTVQWVYSWLEKANSLNLKEDKLPSVSFLNKIKDSGFNYSLNPHIQWKPSSIHQLSRVISNKIEDNNIFWSFDNEVYDVIKKRGRFLISSEKGDYSCKKIILCVGRTGWRWVTDLYKKFGIYTDDSLAEYGVMVEMPALHMKDLNKSHLSINKDNLNIGPFSWSGSVIPEDHADLVISSFRSNEDRWKSEKVYFSLLYSKYVEDEATKYTERVAKLSYLLYNDRISREKIKNFRNKNSLLSLLPEYDWLHDKLEEIQAFIPNIMTNGYFHIPNIRPLAAGIRLGSNLESEIDDMFIAGESAKVSGILSAAIMGSVAADSACK